MNEVSFKIDEDEFCLYGIFRNSFECRKLLILVPAYFGTRIGPQRIFVDISLELLKQGFSTLCIELPSNGDSYTKSRINFQNFEKNYSYYLEKVLNQLPEEYKHLKCYLLSISYGCMPVLNFAFEKRLDGAILLSPNIPENNNIRLINLGNFHAYCAKLFQAKTWMKLFTFNINFKNILKNVFNYKKKKKIKAINKGHVFSNCINHDLRVLCLVGGKDCPTVFLKKYIKQNSISSFKEVYIKDSDHSFFSWGQKQEVIREIKEWFNNVT